MQTTDYSPLSAASVFSVQRMSALAFVLFAAIIVGKGVLLLIEGLKGDRVPKGLKPLPGPPGKPFIGNAGQFDPLAPYVSFQKWSKEYGPMFQVKLGPQTYISVNDPVIAKELFERRGNTYNSRISTHVAMSSSLRSGESHSRHMETNTTHSENRSTIFCLFPRQEITNDFKNSSPGNFCKNFSYMRTMAVPLAQPRNSSSEDTPLPS